MDIRRLVLRIPGQWEDAWLYRGNLIVWDRHGAIYYVPVDKLRASAIHASDRHHGVLADHLVLRSERKSSLEFQDVLAIPSIRREFFSPLKAEPEVVISITPTVLRLASIEPIPGNITDTVVYGNRIFATSDAGVYETQFDSRYDEPSPVLQVIDAPATAVVAGNGQFAASLGDLGLISREVGFGDGDQWIRSAKNASVETLAPYSRNVTRSSVHLLNYGVDPIPDFIRATTRIDRRENGFQESIVTKFHQPSSLLQSLRGVMSEELTVDEMTAGDRFEVLGNANYRLLVRFGSKVQVLNLRAFQNQPLRVNQDRRIDVGKMMTRPIRHAMSTQALRSGFLVEHTGGVHILNDSGVIELTKELVVQARTFPNSRRYVDTVVLVREECLDLVGFVDLAQ
ncbi:hypothetical protein SAMN05216281_1562 [Cryobacterium luteum]|nr:hypothetical protein SAMN05216281_1562 [Cryobacterium luteum]